MSDYQQWENNHFYGYSGNKNPWFPEGRPGGPSPMPGRPGGPSPMPGRPGGPPPMPGRPGGSPPMPGKGCPCIRGWNLDENDNRENNGMSESDEMNNDLYMGDLEEPNRMEEEWMYMKQLYPNRARKLLRYIEDGADQLEYANSMMFDERPDQTAVDMLVREVIGKIQDMEPELLQGNGGDGNNTTWSGCSEILVYVLLVNEMHHRRRRYFMMNNRNY